MCDNAYAYHQIDFLEYKQEKQSMVQTERVAYLYRNEGFIEIYLDKDKTEYLTKAIDTKRMVDILTRKYPPVYMLIGEYGYTFERVMWI